MSNKKVLSQATRGLNKAKAPSKSRDIIYDPMGQWAHPGQPTRIPSSDITMQGVPFPVVAYPNVGQPQMMYPGQDYNFPEADYVDEYPQMKRGGLKKNKTSRSLMATNKLFAKHAFFKKPGKNVIFDPNSPYFQDGGEQEAMNAMMKARLAYANMFGNPSAQRMINIPDQPYEFDNGDIGTHYMASMDNYAVPQIQDENGQLMLGNYGPESNEAIRFDSDEDANYFAENYKDVSPGFMDVELDDNEIEEYKRGGYVVEDISVPELQEGGEEPKLNLDLPEQAGKLSLPKSKLKQYMSFQKGGELFTMKGSNSVYRKVNGKWEVDTNRSGKFQPLSKGDVKQRTAVLNKQATPLFDPEYQDRVNTQSEGYKDTKSTQPKKQLTTEDKRSQENFDKNFGVEGKDNYTKFKDKVQENLKLWAGERDNYGDYDDGEWESAVEDLTQKKWDEEQYNAKKNTTRRVIVPDVDGVGQHWETWYPDDQIAFKMNKDAPRETNAQYRQAKQDWDKKNFLEKIGTSIGYDLGIIDRGNPYKEYLPAPIAGTPRIAEDMTGIGRGTMFTKGAKYLQQAANLFKEEGGQLNSIETELTDAEIEQLKKQGYVIELI